MSETRDYLDHHAQVTADNVVATIESVNDDGTYMVRYISGQRAIRRAAPATFDTYREGERVTISRPSASRSVIGTMDTIISRAPREQRGLSGTTPAEERRSVTRPVVITVVPDPLEIREGGEAGEQTFTGSGFDSTPATYVSAHEGGPDPVLTDAVAPEAAATEVVMTVSADSGSPRGDFDAIVSGVRVKKALRILRSAPFPQYGFFTLADPTAQKLVAFAYVVEPAPWTTLAHVRWQESAVLGGTPLRLVQLADAAFLVLFTGGGGRRVDVNPTTGVFTFDEIGTYPEPDPFAQFAVNGDFVYYGTAANEFVEIDVSAGVATRTLLAASSAPYRPALFHPGTDSIITANAADVAGDIKIHKIARITGSDTTAQLVLAPASPDVVVADGDDLWFVMSGETSGDPCWIRRILASSLSGTHSSPFLENGERGNAHAFYANGKVWVQLRSIDPEAQRRGSLDVPVPVDTASSWGGEFSVGTEGAGAVAVPAGQGPFGPYPFEWRVMRETVGTPMVIIRGRDMNPSASVEGIELHIPSTDIAPAAADCGLCWTPR